MCTDTSLDAIDIIRLYGLRASRSSTPSSRQCAKIGSFTYHFWMSNMKPLRRNSGNAASPLIPRSSTCNDVKRKLHAYHVFIQAASSARDCCLASRRCSSPARLELFRPWLRTIRPGIPPSELVVAITLRQSLPEFLLNNPKSSIFTKFVTERQDTNLKRRPFASPPDTQIPRKPRTRESVCLVLSNQGRSIDR